MWVSYLFWKTLILYAFFLTWQWWHVVSLPCCFNHSDLDSHPFKASLCPCDVMKSLRVRDLDKVEWARLWSNSQLKSVIHILIKWLMIPCSDRHLAYGNSRCFLGVPQSGKGANSSNVTPGETVNPGEQWLHVSQTVNQPCKPLPLWHKVPLIWKISKRVLPVAVELDDRVAARADWLQHYIMWKDRHITSVWAFSPRLCDLTRKD